MKITKKDGGLHIENEINKTFIDMLKADVKNPFSISTVKSDYQIGMEFEFYVLNKGKTANERIDNMDESIDGLLHQLSFINKDIEVLSDSFEDEKNTDYAYLEKDGTLKSKLGEGFEFVSPKMDLKDVSFYFKTVSDIIDGVGYTNDTCGLHFHISSDKLQNIDMAKLLTFLHAQDSLFDNYLDRNQYVKSLERVFLNSKLDTFNEDIREQSKQYDIVYIDGNHIELRVFGGADVYRDAENILNKLNVFLGLHKIACSPEMEKELYKELVEDNLSQGHHSLEKTDIDTLIKVAEEIRRRSGIEIGEAFEEAFNACEENVITPQSMIDEFQERNTTAQIKTI
jgi:hypothetical protein